MNRFEQYIKQVAYMALLVVLFLPMLQSKFKLIESKPLDGDVQLNEEDPYISKERWLEGIYQREQEQYLNEHAGFRNELIRIYNQWNYTLYKKTTAKGVVIGKAGYLYEENYIRAYLGMDFIGEDSIRRQVEKLKIITANLKKRNIDLIVLLAPGKASFYPEYIPDSYKTIKQQTQNIQVFRRELANTNVNTFDAYAWFLSMKETVHKEHRLYSKTGIHWSKYGEVLVADSLIRYINKVRSVHLPSVQISGVEKSVFLRETDNDIFKGMNLIFSIPDFEMSYPKYTLGEPADKSKVRVLTIADSYFWGMYWMGLPQKLFNNGDFWYYFENSYPTYFENPSQAKVNDFNLDAEISKNDLILLVCTDANLSNLGFGFIEKYYSLLKKDEKID